MFTGNQAKATFGFLSDKPDSGVIIVKLQVTSEESLCTSPHPRVAVQ